MWCSAGLNSWLWWCIVLVQSDVLRQSWSKVVWNYRNTSKNLIWKELVIWIRTCESGTNLGSVCAAGRRRLPHLSPSPAASSIHTQTCTYTHTHIVLFCMRNRRLRVAEERDAPAQTDEFKVHFCLFPDCRVVKLKATLQRDAAAPANLLRGSL